MILGLSAGMTPGPLMALMFSQTIQYGIGAGVRIALVPLITATPVLLVSLIVVNGLSEYSALFGMVTISGGLYVGWLGWKDLRFNGIAVSNRRTSSRPLYSGIMVNLLSPYPYMFWFSVGAPMVFKAAQSTLSDAAVFISGFFIFVVGVMIVLALLVERSRSILEGTAYIYTIRFLGGVMLLLAVLLMRDGIMLISARAVA